MRRHKTTKAILVTGGAGFVGSHLIEQLLAEGHRVIALDNLATGTTRNILFAENNRRFDLVLGDVTDLALVQKLTGSVDTVVHLAAAVGVKLILTDALHSLKTNITGTETVLEACARRATKVLIASTSEVYGKVAQLPQREDDDVLLGPTCYTRWSYAAAKMLDEFMALAYCKRGVPIVVFRLFNTVGPRQTGRYGMVVPRFVSAAIEGRPIPVYGDGTQSRCFVHVRDAVDAVVRLERTPKAVGEVFNIGSQESVTIHELALRVLAAVEARQRHAPGASLGHSRPEPAIRLIPYEQAYPTGGFDEIGHRLPEISKIRSVTRWRPRRTLDEILTDVIDAHTVAVPTPVEPDAVPVRA